MQHLGNGIAAVAELDGDFLLQHKALVKRFVPFAKVPSSARDVSLLVPLSLEAVRVQSEITQADKRIVDVSLVDFFEKAEWADKRSLTFRYVMQDPEKTLTKEEADAIEQRVVAKLVALGVTVR
jgi:phenylalanyl-tRNA synthetase beta subunit